jgi:hypothetical protein
MSDHKIPFSGFGSAAIHAGRTADGNYAHLAQFTQAALLFSMMRNKACADLRVKKKVISIAVGGTLL